MQDFADVPTPVVLETSCFLVMFGELAYIVVEYSLTESVLPFQRQVD